MTSIRYQSRRAPNAQEAQEDNQEVPRVHSAAKDLRIARQLM